MRHVDTGIGRSAGDYLRGLFEFGLTQSPSLKSDLISTFLPTTTTRQLIARSSRQLHRLPDKPSLDRFLSSQTGAYTSAWKGIWHDGEGGPATDSHSRISFLPIFPIGAMFISFSVARSDRTIGHEVRHSVDPHTAGYDRRNGYDRMLGEFFAYYNECIVQEGNRWDLLKRYVGGDGYFSSYTKQAENPSPSNSMVSASTNVLQNSNKYNASPVTLRRNAGSLNSRRLTVF